MQSFRPPEPVRQCQVSTRPVETSNCELSTKTNSTEMMKRLYGKPGMAVNTGFARPSSQVCVNPTDTSLADRITQTYLERSPNQIDDK